VTSILSATPKGFGGAEPVRKPAWVRRSIVILLSDVSHRVTRIDPQQALRYE
jgi:hypothetical protein